MIIPGILTNTFEDIEKEVALVDSAAHLIQIDVADGKFVDNKTFLDVEKLDSIDTKAEFELHLMVENPLKFLEKKIEKVKKIIIHVEIPNVKEALSTAKKLGYEVGISINPDTDVEKLAPYMNMIDYVQFMTVIPGKQGQEFNRGALDAITIFRQTAPKITIQADGGIDEETLEKVLEAGAQHAVVGSQIFQTPVQSFKHLQEKTNHVREHGHEVRHKIKRVAFLGGASWTEDDEVYKDAFAVAKLLAEKGYQIINGGGPGVMRASTEGSKAVENSKEVIAVTYYPPYKHKNYEGTDPLNKFDEEIVTTDYFDRTKVMLQNADIHVIFKGGTGTISEFGMTWASSRIHQGHNKPIILFGDFWDHIIEEFQTHMWMRQGEAELLSFAETPEKVLEIIEGF